MSAVEWAVKLWTALGDIVRFLTLVVEANSTRDADAGGRFLVRRFLVNIFLLFLYFFLPSLLSPTPLRWTYTLAQPHTYYPRRNYTLLTTQLNNHKHYFHPYTHAITVSNTLYMILLSYHI